MEYAKVSVRTVWGQSRRVVPRLAYVDGLVQKRRNSIANALELRLSCTNPSVFNKEKGLWRDLGDILQGIIWCDCKSPPMCILC